MSMHTKRYILLGGVVALISCLMGSLIIFSHPSPSYSQSTFDAQAEARTDLISQMQSMTEVPVMLPETVNVVEGDLFAIPTYIDQDRYDVTISSVQDCSASACTTATISGFRVENEQVFFASLQEFIPDGEWLEEGLQDNTQFFYYEPMVCNLNCNPSSIYWISPVYSSRGGKYIYQISMGSQKEDLLPLIWSLVNSSIN